jgi:cytochrome c
MTSTPRCASALFSFILLGGLAGPAVAQSGGGPHPQVRQGEKLYAQHCALCHGTDGRGGQAFPRPIWGTGHDLGKFGNARGLFDYLQLMMPFDAPAKMSDDDKLAVTAFMLTRDGAFKGGGVLDLGEAGRIPLK